MLFRLFSDPKHPEIDITSHTPLHANHDETRLADVGEEPESTYTFFWSGKPAVDKREAGVRFAIIRSKLVPSLKEKPKAINCRLMTVRLALPQQRCATLISVYAPTLQHSDESKEEFYSELRNVIDSVPRQDKLIILGDFNARVGADWSAWEGVLGKHGVGKCNANGQLLLELCMTYDLNITNTTFHCPTGIAHLGCTHAPSIGISLITFL